MYYASKGITDKKQMTAQPPSGPGFTQTQADEAATMDILNSSFKDDGDDYTMFILRNSEGEVVNKSVVGGY